MKRMIILSLFVLFFGLGCSEEGNNSGTVYGSKYNAGYGYRNISAHQAKNLIDTRKDVLVVDVRTPQELKTGIIKNSINISMRNIMTGNYNLPGDKALIIVCAVGSRSAYASRALVKNGYKEIYNLSGGMHSWKREGLPVKY